MSCAYIASGKHEVFNIFRIKGTQRDPVRLGKPFFLQVRAILAAHCKAAGQVIVDLPAAVGNLVGELSAVFNVLLSENVVADIAAAFPLAGEEADKVKLPVVRAVVAAVFHVIPHAESDLQKLIARRFGVMYRIRLAAKLYPVEIGVYFVKALVGLELHFLIGVKSVCPVGSGELAHMVGFVCLDHKAHAHCLTVCLGQTEGFAEFRFCLASYHVFGIRKLGKNAVARTVDEYLCLYRAPCVCGKLKSGDAFDPAVAALGGAAGAVEHQLNVFLCLYLAVKDGVPYREVAFGIDVHILKHYLLHYPGLLEVAHACSGSRNPHSYLA